MKKIGKNKIIVLAILLVVTLLSIFVLSKVTTNPEFHAKTIASLDDKKTEVLKLTAASTAAATAIAAIPGDATTPVANKLADLSSYFLMILAVVFLEKYLVTLTGYATFGFLIPLACALFAIGYCFGKSTLKFFAAKIAVFGLVIFLAIPTGMKVSEIIENTYESSVEETMKKTQETTEQIEESQDSDGNIIEKALAKITGGVTGLIKKGEELLNNFIEAIAVMLVTSCVIPIVVVLFGFWLVKILFGIEVPESMKEKVKKPMQKRIEKK